MENQKRKLASIQKVRKVIKHPNADRLEICTVNDWNVISKMGDFKEGDLCCFFENDMSQFKLGDFVITEFTIDKVRGVKKIIKLEDDGWHTFQNEDGTVEAAPYTIIGPWQPKVGEWCWFENKRTETACIAQWQSHNYGTHCEPFFGQLPTFLK